MAPEPVSFRLSQMIAEADRAIKETDDALAPHRASNKPIPKALLSQYYRLHQHRHALELQRTYPQAVILTDVHFTSIMGADGQQIALNVKKGAGRIADAAIVYGDRVWLIEEKVLDEVLRAFPKKANARLQAEKIVPSSKAGTQLANELKILKQAGRKGVMLGITGVPVLGGPRVEMLPEVDNIAPSRLQTYRNMGDGPQVPQGPPTTRMPGTAKPLVARDIVSSQGAPSIQAVAVPPPAQVPPPPVSTPPIAGKTLTPPPLPTPDRRGGVLQPPVPVRGVTGNPQADRGADRPQTGRGRWRWPATTGNVGGGMRPQAGTTLQRARGAAGGAAGAMQQISQGLTQRAHQAVWDRAARAAAEPDIWRRVQQLRHDGNWVWVKGVFWHDQPTFSESNDVRFQAIEVLYLHDPHGAKDEESARGSSNWRNPPSVSQRWSPGEQRNMPKYYHASGQELNFYAPEPEFEYFDEDISVGNLKMGRCVRRKLR
ncbi:hypothetical protein [Chelatococcus reniformis]|uniref:Uncharacterized protein n=1 Tax=Chelatococcus reniformis TaxID=1494448 RepID=A0A916UK02_9HYPH|nr:hypothetical protein [Chelatococcus reniformis]GGC75759.1 hypothetical protein GCM10010994_37730 [Chelatococcus reniformis]